MKRSYILGGLVVLALIGAWHWRMPLRDWYLAETKQPIPTAMPYHTPTPTTPSSVTPAPITLAVNLDVPFVSQAPHKIWDEDHEEFCEEAAALMAASYILGDHTVVDPDIAEQKLQEIKAYELRTFGYFKDTTAAETARILRGHFGVNTVLVVPDPTEVQIKAWLSTGRIVLVPAAGRELGNPNFKSPGPLYHMIVIKGYTKTGQFITNDPGTRKGADYIYDASVIMNAMHDWNGGDVLNGAKVVIVVG